MRGSSVLHLRLDGRELLPDSTIKARPIGDLHNSVTGQADYIAYVVLSAGAKRSAAWVAQLIAEDRCHFSFCERTLLLLRVSHAGL